jgi:hypothetical protein
MSFTRFISSLTKAVSLRNSRNLQRLWVFRNLRNEAPCQLPQAAELGRQSQILPTMCPGPIGDSG